MYAIHALSQILPIRTDGVPFSSSTHNSDGLLLISSHPKDPIGHDVRGAPQSLCKRHAAARGLSPWPRVNPGRGQLLGSHSLSSHAPWPGPLPTHTWVPLQRRVHGVADHRNSEGGTQCKGRRLNPPCRACTSNATIAVVIERARAHPHVHSLHLLVQRRCKHSRPAPGIVAGARAACVSSQCADEPAGEARG
jgi:hypothetical protein